MTDNVQELLRDAMLRAVLHRQFPLLGDLERAMFGHPSILSLSIAGEKLDISYEIPVPIKIYENPIAYLQEQGILPAGVVPEVAVINDQRHAQDLGVKSPAREEKSLEFNLGNAYVNLNLYSTCQPMPDLRERHCVPAER